MGNEQENLADRVARLEAELELLKSRVDESRRTNGSWVDRITGSFKDDHAFEEILRLGREYRESLRLPAEG